MNPTRVHQVLNDLGAIAFAGVFDALSAKLAEDVGFPVAFVSGYSVAATLIGEPDFGLLTQTEMIDRARRICMRKPNWLSKSGAASFTLSKQTNSSS